MRSFNEIFIEEKSKGLIYRSEDSFGYSETIIKDVEITFDDGSKEVGSLSIEDGETVKFSYLPDGEEESITQVIDDKDEKCFDVLNIIPFYKNFYDYQIYRQEMEKEREKYDL